MADLPPYPGTPLWVKVSAFCAGILLLLALGLIIAGGGRHGPGRHIPSSQSAATHDGADR